MNEQTQDYGASSPVSVPSFLWRRRPSDDGWSVLMDLLLSLLRDLWSALLSSKEGVEPFDASSLVIFSTLFVFPGLQFEKSGSKQAPKNLHDKLLMSPHLETVFLFCLFHAYTSTGLLVL